MSDDDELLKRLGALAKAQSEERAAEAPLDDLARARIVAHLADRVPAKRPSPMRRIGGAIGGLALAAALLLAITRFSASDPLPEYALQSSGASTVRGPSPAGPGRCVLQASEQGAFEMVASAERPVSPPIVARAFLVKGDKLVPWTEIETSAQGSVRVSGAASALTGAKELRVVVARSESEALAQGNGARVLRCAIE